MAGTKAGGLKAAKANRERWGDDFYSKIGTIGGKRGTTGGFASAVPCECSTIRTPHFVRNCAGRRGGLKSRRGSHA